MGEPGTWGEFKLMTNVAWQMAQAGRKAAVERAEKFRQENEAALPYDVIATVRVVRRRPKGFYNIPIDVVRSLLDSKLYLHTTNEQIIDGLQTKWAPEPIPKNFMDKALTAAKLKVIAAVLAEAGLAFDPKTHKSLSKIKLAIQAGKAAADAELSFTGTVTFGRDCVTVGAKRFPFGNDANGYQRIKVGPHKLRVDVLRALLEAGGLQSSTK